MQNNTSVSAAPVVTLSNGLRVANFSSPHPFNFEDGNVLDACLPDRVTAGALEREEEVRPWPAFWDRDDIFAVVPKFSISEQVWSLLVELENYHGVDIVLVPFPVLEALRNAKREDGQPLLLEITKAGTICVKDRQTKTIFINRFCR
jgi:hypothetical protein